MTRRDVSESKRIEAGVGFGTVLTLPLEIEGIVTGAPPPRSLLTTGDTVVEVGGRPAVLVVGRSPLYRPLRLVAAGELDEAGGRLARLSGPDVAMLQRFLLAAGFDDGGRLVEDEEFGPSTRRAVKAWQTSVGHPATGVIDRSQMVFATSELLMQSELAIGQPFSGVEVTGIGTVLQAFTPTTVREYFTVGSTVEVMTDDGDRRSGRVTRSSRTRTESGDVLQLIEVAVDGVDPDELGQSVQVIGSVTRASDVLTVPVRALLATDDGGWRLEVADEAGTRLVAVDLLRVVDTTAIVSGVEEGTDVVVPR